MANIKNIKVGNDTYDIEALHFIAGDLNTPAQWKAYIDRIAELGFEIVVLTTLPKEDAASYETYHNNIVLITDNTSVTGSSVEYVIVRSGTSESYTYKWERIGTTTVDLTAYAKVGMPTSGPSTANTSSTDLGTKTTSEAKAASAEAEVSLKYAKADATTGSAGATTTANSGNGGSHTINGSSFTFTGEDQSIEVTVNRTADVAVGAHSYTPAGTVNVSHDAIKDVTLSASDATTAGPKYVESVTHTAATLGGITSFNTDAIKNATLSVSTTTSTGAVKYVESVTHKAATLGGITSFNTDAYKASVTGTTLVLTSAAKGTVTISGGSVTPDTKYVKVATTAASKGTVTISGGAVTPVTKYMGHSKTAAKITPSFTGTAATLSHSVTQPTFTGSFNNKSIAGTIGGSQSVGNHSHTYVALQAHTHAITYTETDVAGEVNVPIPPHTHTVTIGSHAHTLNSHTHTQK